MPRKRRNIPNMDDVPEGTTQRASDRTSRPGGPEATPLDDRYAAGTPGGGTEVGGLAGSNYGDGDPDERELHDAAATNLEIEADDEDAYAGFSGGAVGGTPAGRRASGGKTHGGLSPGGGPSRRQHHWGRS